MMPVMIRYSVMAAPRSSRINSEHFARKLRQLNRLSFMVKQPKSEKKLRRIRGICKLFPQSSIFVKSWFLYKNRHVDILFPIGLIDHSQDQFIGLSSGRLLLPGRDINRVIVPVPIGVNFAMEFVLRQDGIQ